MERVKELWLGKCAHKISCDCKCACKVGSHSIFMYRVKPAVQPWAYSKKFQKSDQFRKAPDSELAIENYSVRT